MIGALGYCICGASGYVATSPDAVAWSTVATGTTNQMYTVVCGPDRFVVFGGFRCIHILDSGALDIYTTTYEFPFSAYYDGTYYWVAANHTTQILRSPDAIAWTLVALPGVSAAVVSVGGEGSKLLVGRDFGYYSFSEDGGITWTTLRLGANAKWVADVNLGEYIISGFDRVETSPTALFGSWTVASNSIFTAPPRSGTRFGKNGSLIVHSGGGRDYSSDCHRSADNGLSFTLLTAFPGTSTGINGDCLFDGERFILTGSLGEIVQLDNEGYEATILANVGVSVQGIAYYATDPIPPSSTQGTHDLLILPNGRAETTESLAQRVDVRLRTFIGEHWLNPELGVPWFEEFLRKAPDLAACRQILVAVLQDVPGVVAVESVDVTFDKNSRQMRVSFAVSGSDSIPQSGLTAVTL